MRSLMVTRAGKATRDVDAIAPLAPNAWLRYDLVERMLPAGITDVLEMTRRLRNCARSPISSSVMPSAKYSWAGSSERFSRGKTAREPNCFGERDAFTVAFDEPRGQRIHPGNFATTTMKTMPSSDSATKLNRRNLQRELDEVESEAGTGAESGADDGIG